ncbi:condensation domain-containing protein [Kribbella sp. NBC_01245]|uniref:condensation domain-containing protein n=1 Tax=Kribbella sp. NBC_01245 TaxID=2903578 RepID=UPI002E2E3820|nr:condensation domain-containing protein [Kribbella sp. NBC_01245]
MTPASLWQTFALDLDKARPGFAKGPWFTMNAMVELDGPVDIAVLARAFDDLQRRHDVLRTTVDDEPLQVVADEPLSPLEVFQEAPEIHAPVDRLAPVRLRIGEDRIALHLHHLISDPVTLWAAFADLAACYTARLWASELPPPAAQYADYTLDEAEQVRRNRDAAERWWQTVLGEAAAPPSGPAGDPFAFRAQLLTSAETARAEDLIKAKRSTMLVSLLTALADGMTPYAGPGDTMVFSTLFGKRDRPAWQSVLGPCIVPSYLVVPMASTGDHLAAVRDSVVGCSRYARFPQSEIAQGPRTPFFEYVAQGWPEAYKFGGVTGSVVAAAGPKDTGLAGALGIRARKTAEGALSAHFSADGTDWTETHMAQLRTHFAEQLQN